VTADIQKGFYGRVLNPNDPAEPPDEQRFAYPLYAIFLLAPTVVLSFPSVQLIYWIIALAGSAASVYFWLSSYKDRVNWPTLISGMLLFVGSYPVVEGLRVEQPTIVIAAMIAGAFAAVSAGSFIVAGISLAAAMVKPQITLPIAVWLMMWALSKWPERKRLFGSFCLTMAAMLVGAELCVPGWFWEWQNGLSAYMHYAFLPKPQIQLLFGDLLGTALGTALLIGICMLCWRARHDSTDHDSFKLVPALILAAALVLSPVWHPYDNVILLPAVLLGFHWRQEFARMQRVGRVVLQISAGVIGWQWIAALFLLLIAVVSPVLARHWVVLPGFGIILSPTFALVSLILMARERMSRSEHARPVGKYR
jgi:hypothetical protein